MGAMMLSAGMSQNVNPCAGTPLYMAPELFKGQRFTNKVDVFAYGVIVWEIYAREKPWVGYDPLDVRTEVCEDDVHASPCNTLSDPSAVVLFSPPRIHPALFAHQMARCAFTRLRQ